MNTKTLLLSAGMICAVLTGTMVQAATEVIDQVIAIVDDDIIMAMIMSSSTIAIT